MFVDGDSEVKPTATHKRLLKIYKSLLQGLDDGARQKKWEMAGRALTKEQLMSWWAGMSEEFKIGLKPPAGLGAGNGKSAVAIEGSGVD